MDRCDDGHRGALDQVGDGLDPGRAPARIAGADEARDVRARRERTLAPAAQHDHAHLVVQLFELGPERVDDPAIDGVDRRVVEPDGLDHDAGAIAVAGSGANISRSSVLRNLPTLVFGISAMNSNRSGSHHFAKSGARNARNSSDVAD